jgi:DNA-binding response OmpR family regulator
MSKNILVVVNSYLPSASSGLLTREGYKVDMKNSIDIDLKHVDIRDYDIIIIQTGRETGEWQLCEQIRSLSGQPLIVIGTDASADTCAKAIDAGADYFLRKPFGPMELNARIRSLLQNKSSESSAPAVV